MPRQVAPTRVGGEALLALVELAGVSGRWREISDYTFHESKSKKYLPCFHVPGDLGALPGGVVAERAAVGPLARVRPPVHLQVRLFGEILPAELAGAVVSRGRGGSPVGGRTCMCSNFVMSRDIIENSPFYPKLL